jgi:hypothetical protein
MKMSSAASAIRQYYGKFSMTLLNSLYNSQRMMKTVFYALWILLIIPAGLIAQTKQARAVRVANGSIHIDGVLDDQVWLQATPIEDFVQKEPNEGIAPTENTQVRVLYDDTALYIGARQRAGGNARGEVSLTFLNFWNLSVETGPDFRVLDSRLTRGGPLMEAPAGWTTELSLRNRPAAQSGWNINLTRTVDEDGGRNHNFRSVLSFRPAPRWQLSVTPTYIRQRESQQYVTTLAGGLPVTYGQRYIFSYIDRSTVSTQFRMGFTLKPDVNIDLYAEPFAASGKYYDFGELTAPRVRQRRLYGTGGTTVTLQPDGSRTITDGSSTFALRNLDFNVRSFRSNVVLRREYRPGSTLYLVWQQNRHMTEPLGDRASAADMFRSFTAPGSNYFVVKMSFWKPLG